MDEENNKKPVEITSDDYMKATADSNPSYYDLLRETSARDLLDQNVATQLAKEVASKNVTRTMQGMGLDNSGYGATAAALIGNKAQGEMALNSRNYINRINEIYQQEQQEAAAKATNLMDGLQMYGTTPATMEQYLKDHGFEINDGKLTYKGNEGFTDYMVGQVQDYYNAVMNNSGLGVNSAGYTDPAALMNSIKTADGQSGDKIKNELYKIFHIFKNDTPPNGYVIRLVNGSNSSTYANVMYYNGKWYQVNDAVYDQANANNKLEIKNENRAWLQDWNNTH